MIDSKWGCTLALGLGMASAISLCLASCGGVPPNVGGPTAKDAKKATANPPAPAPARGPSKNEAQPRPPAKHTRAVLQAVPSQPDFSRHIAPMLFAHCAKCHRDGQAAPFELLTYEDAYEHAAEIVEVTRDRIMPPWKPVPGHVEFSNDRSLTDAEIKTFARWVETGMPAGDPGALPPTPTWSEGWQLGEPDLVVELPESYELAAEGSDIYRNFVLSTGTDRDHWIVAWEFRPSNPRVIHHAILNVDRGDWARERDAAEPGPGFDGMESQATQSPGGVYLVWAPGNRAQRNPEGLAWPLERGTDLVLQLHLQPTGKLEPVRPKIGLYFADAPPTRRSFVIRIGDVDIDIPPGEADYRIRDRYTLPVPGRMIAAFPHAHYLGKRVHVRARRPDGQRQWLLRIDDWDFNWQDEYRYLDPPHLPAGTQIELEISYDNSADNPNNPQRPPRRVTQGWRSFDEMGNISLQFVPDDPKAIVALRELKYRRELRHGPSAKTHYNLGNVAMNRNDPATALKHYERAIALDANHYHAHHNASVVLQGQRKFDAALTHARREVELRPTSAAAHNNLATVLDGLGRREDAMAAIRTAVRHDPEFIPARRNLALALEARGMREEAGVHRLAIANLERGDFAAQIHAGQSLAGQRRWGEAIVYFERALALKPDDPQLPVLIDRLRAQRSPQTP